MAEGRGSADEAERRFVEAMRLLRQRKGWSQERLSQELGNVGTPINPSSITKIEWLLDEERSASARPLRLHEAAAIARLLDSDVALMMHGDPVVFLPDEVLEIAKRDYADALAEEARIRAMLTLAESQSKILKDRLQFTLTEFGDEVARGEHPEEA